MPFRSVKLCDSCCHAPSPLSPACLTTNIRNHDTQYIDLDIAEINIQRVLGRRDKFSSCWGWRRWCGGTAARVPEICRSVYGDGGGCHSSRGGRLSIGLRTAPGPRLRTCV